MWSERITTGDANYFLLFYLFLLPCLQLIQSLHIDPRSTEGSEDEYFSKLRPPVDAILQTVSVPFHIWCVTFFLYSLPFVLAIYFTSNIIVPIGHSYHLPHLVLLDFPIQT